MNVSAIISVFKIIRDPSLCLPHYTVANFGLLPIPLSGAFAKYQSGEKSVDIRAVVLDKDNCFAKPHENAVHRSYAVRTFYFITGWSKAS